MQAAGAQREDAASCGCAEEQQNRNRLAAAEAAAIAAYNRAEAAERRTERLLARAIVLADRPGLMSGRLWLKELLSKDVATGGRS